MNLMISKEEILGAADALYEQTVGLRRHLHRHPERSFCERETSHFVQERLRALGIPFRTGYAEHGVAAFVDGVGEGPTVVLRADMDALPITEDPKHECCSENEGVMHACGHDFHTASLLAVAQILAERRDKFRGRVMLVFQPGEESDPGGARVMMRDGLFDGITPKVVIGAHVLAEMPVGHVGFREGEYMASADEIHLIIKGHGGHGGMPHLLTDNVLTACETVCALQRLVAREVPATTPAVLSFGRIIADGATNVVPSEVFIDGTMRLLGEQWRAKMKERIRTIARCTAEAAGATCEFDIRDGYPSVYNDPEATRRVRAAAMELLGAENVEEMGVRMTAEDFGFYTVRYPSVFYRFGVGRKDGSTGNAHTSQFDPDEEALRIAPAVMAYAALKELV